MSNLSIKNLFTLIGNNFIQKKLLWTNPNPGSVFAAQTITLDLSGYDVIGVEYSSHKDFVNKLYQEISREVTGRLISINASDGN